MGDGVWRTWYPMGYPGPYACNVDVRTFAVRQWWTNVNINFFSTTSIPHEQHAFGTGYTSTRSTANE